MPCLPGGIDADLSLTGPVTDPLLKGDIKAEKTRISLASSPGLPANFDLRLISTWKPERTCISASTGWPVSPKRLFACGRLVVRA